MCTCLFVVYQMMGIRFGDSINLFIHILSIPFFFSDWSEPSKSKLFFAKSGLENLNKNYQKKGKKSNKLMNYLFIHSHCQFDSRWINHFRSYCWISTDSFDSIFFLNQISTGEKTGWNLRVFFLTIYGISGNAIFGRVLVWKFGQIWIYLGELEYLVYAYDNILWVEFYIAHIV